MEKEPKEENTTLPASVDQPGSLDAIMAEDNAPKSEEQKQEEGKEDISQDESKKENKKKNILKKKQKV